MSLRKKRSCYRDCNMVSSLPEHLISRIISELETEEAIRTSVLSKSFRFCWTSISNLDFSDEFVMNPDWYLGDDPEPVIDKAEDDLLFKNFADYVDKTLLQLKTSCIDEFYLHLARHPDRSCLERWISAAIKLNVRDVGLRLESFNENPTRIDPSQLFNCKSLEALSIREGVILDIPKRFENPWNLKFLSLSKVRMGIIPAKESFPYFPKLETLHLGNVTFAEGKKGPPALILNCPALKHFSVAKSMFDNGVSNIELRIPLLERAELLFCSRVECIKAKITAPVKYLKLNLDPTHKLIVKHPDSLMEVDLCIRLTLGWCLDKITPEQSDEIFKLIKTFEKVTSLDLRDCALSAIRISKIKLPLFCNITRLLVEYKCEEVDVLRCLLDNSINLEYLIIIRIVTLTSCHVKEDWLTAVSRVPKCFQTSLKRVEIVNAGCPCEADMVKGMLKWGEKLKKITLRVSDLKEEDIILLKQKVSTCSRASASCEVDIRL